MNQLQEKYKKEITELVEASNQLGKHGYVASHGGNLSCRLEENLVLITPTKVPKGKITFDDIVIVDMTGNLLFAAEGRKPTGETPMHLHIFHKRDDINAIIHSHPPVLTGFAIAHSDLLEKAILPEVVIEIGPVLSVDYAQPLSQDLADAFNPVVDYSNAFLMKNHGVMVCSREGVSRALEFTEILEAMAKSLTIAKSLGHIETLREKDLLDLENVLKTRDMLLPGAPGMVNSLCELY